MAFSVKEQKLHLKDFQIDTIRFGTGKKNLIMIQGLNTNGIKGGQGSPLPGWIKNAGHTSNTDQPEIVNGLIEELVRMVPAAHQVSGDL